MPPRIAFISPSGYGNLGDAAIIDSLIQGIRRRTPDAEIVGFTLNPVRTAEQHGVPAFACGAFRRGWYAVQHPTPGEFYLGSSASWREIESSARRLVRTVPPLRTSVNFTSLVLADRRYRRKAADLIRGFEAVVVAGGGQLNELFGGPLGHPCTLWRWAGLAHQVGARYLVLSVGTGTLATALSRIFVRRALALAEYRSFRDPRSRDLVGDPGLTQNDPIVPDLAYALPIAEPERTARSRSVFGISPMVYGRPNAWPVELPDVFERLVGALSEFAVRLVRAGHEVVLFTSDDQDRGVVAEVLLKVAARLRPDERALVSAPPTTELGELLRLLGQLDVVISGRLHGVLLSHIAGRPTLALAHERKVETLMAEMGLSRYCFNIDDFDLELAWDRLLELHARRAEVSRVIGGAVSDRRCQVEAQFERLFGGSP